MKNITEQILRFKQLSNLISEQGKSDALNLKSDGFCESGDCKDGEGVYLGPLGKYMGSFKNSLFNDSSGNATLETNVSETEFPLENLGLTKNFHTHLFKYTGQFVNGLFDGEGKIEFNDGTTYEGDFKENKIQGIGTFKFKDGSIYQGKVNTINDGNRKSTYSLDYGDSNINDVIDYNSKNTVEILKLDNEEDYIEDDKNNDYYDYSDLDIIISQSDKESKVYNFIDKKTYPQITNKNIKILLKYVGDNKIKKQGSGVGGYFKFGEVRHGRYELKVSCKGFENFEKIIDIDESTKQITIVLKNSSMKENYLVNKIKNLLFETEVTQTSTEKSTEQNEIKICETEIANFYNLYLNVYQEKQKLPRDTNDLRKKRQFVESCATENYRNFNKKTKQYIKSLMSVAPGTKQTIEFEDYFEINPVLGESIDIYSKNFSNTIKKVLSDHKQNKKDSKIEEMIIKNRFNFILESTTLKDFKDKLIIETKDLISKGYDKDIVKKYYKKILN